MARLLADLEKQAPALIVMEASGGYERACADLLAAAGLPVAVINPRQARRFAGSLGQLAKTDRTGHAPTPDRCHGCNGKAAPRSRFGRSRHRPSH